MIRAVTINIKYIREKAISGSTKNEGERKKKVAGKIKEETRSVLRTQLLTKLSLLLKS